jgi:hypothetical protein
MSGLDDIITLLLVGFGPGGLLKQRPQPPPCEMRCKDCVLVCRSRREPYDAQDDRWDDREGYDDEYVSDPNEGIR